MKFLKKIRDHIVGNIQRNLLPALPQSFLFFGCFRTLGVIARTLPALASDPCTLGMMFDWLFGFVGCVNLCDAAETLSI